MTEDHLFESHIRIWLVQLFYFPSRDLFVFVTVTLVFEKIYNMNNVHTKHIR